MALKVNRVSAKALCDDEGHQGSQWKDFNMSGATSSCSSKVARQTTSC
jgi:hypothetical protein